MGARVCPNCGAGNPRDLRAQGYAYWDRKSGTKFTDQQWWLWMIGAPLSLVFIPSLLHALPKGEMFLLRLLIVVWCPLVVVWVACELVLSIVVRSGLAPLQCSSCSTFWGPGGRGLNAIVARRLSVSQALYFTGDVGPAVAHVEQVVALSRAGGLAGASEVWPVALTLGAIYCILSDRKEGNQRAHVALTEALGVAKAPTTITVITNAMAHLNGRGTGGPPDWQELTQRLLAGAHVPPDPPLLSPAWTAAIGIAGIVFALWLFGAFGSGKQSPVTWFYYEVTETIWYRRR